MEQSYIPKKVLERLTYRVNRFCVTGNDDNISFVTYVVRTVCLTESGHSKLPTEN